jgi:hypothetical protein
MRKPQRCWPIALPFVAACAWATILFGAEAKFPGQMTTDQLRAAGFAPLVEGDSLAAWDMKPWHNGHWTIKDGLINYDGKAKGKKFQDNSLWTKKSYGDLTKYAEWRLPEEPRLKPTPIVLYNGDFLMGDDGKRVTRPHLDAGDSGLMFRGTSKCQANIRLRRDQRLPHRSKDAPKGPPCVHPHQECRPAAG